MLELVLIHEVKILPCFYSQTIIALVIEILEQMVEAFLRNHARGLICHWMTNVLMSNQ